MSEEFRFHKEFVFKYCNVHRIFYTLPNFDRVFLNMLTIIKRHKRDEISSKIDELCDINLFLRFTLSLDFQIHFEHDFDWYWNMIARLIQRRFNFAMYELLLQFFEHENQIYDVTWVTRFSCNCTRRKRETKLNLMNDV